MTDPLTRKQIQELAASDVPECFCLPDERCAFHVACDTALYYEAKAHGVFDRQERLRLLYELEHPNEA